MNPQHNPPTTTTATAKPQPASHPTPPNRFYQGTHAGLTALIVDDNQPNRYALTALLHRGNMTVHAAANGPDALNTLTQHPDIDIVLMDIMMPIMDGYQTIAAIRQHPEHQQLPIIAVTATESDGEHQRCTAAGASTYIPKPINTTQLLTAISHWLPAPPLPAITGS
jgi:CheY-like chemotaxis protein